MLNASTYASTTSRPASILAGCSEGDAIVALAANNLGGTAIFGQHLGTTGFAGHFIGDVDIQGTLSAVVKNAVVKNGQGQVKAMICEESNSP